MLIALLGLHCVLTQSAIGSHHLARSGADGEAPVDLPLAMVLKSPSSLLVVLTWDVHPTLTLTMVLNWGVHTTLTLTMMLTDCSHWC